VKSSASQSRDGQSDTGVPQTAAATVAQAILPYQIQLPSDLGDVTTPTLDSRVPARGASSHGSSPSHDFSPQSRDRQGADASNDSAQIQITAPAAAQPLPQFTAVSSTDGVPSLNFDPGIASKPPVSPSDTSDVADTTGKPTVTAAAGSAGDPQQLAFAARVQPVQSVDQSTLPAEMAANAAMASASKKVPPATGDVSPAFASAQLSTSAHTAPEPVSPAIHSAPEAAAPTQRAEASTPLADSLPKTMATPLKDISLQVTQAGKDPVDVRVVQQGGEVHVSVHSGDASLASGLRQGLSDLQSRLEENGYRSEMWRPVASMPLTQTPSAQSSSNHSRGGDGQPQQGGSQQDSGRRNQNQSNQPRWVEELESSFTSGDKSSGDFHGFGS
jgi:hypothetical protein